MTGTRADVTGPVDTQQLRDRYAALRHAPARCAMTRHGYRRLGDPAVVHLLASIPVLCDEVDRLRAVLTLARRDHNDLVAAARATLTAAADGEADHLYYLRDELTVRGLLAARRGDQLW
jgi:hypothetical protein